MHIVYSRLPNRFNLLLILAVSMSGCLYGYNIGAISGVLLFLNKQMVFSHFEASLFVSSFLWGIVAIMYPAGCLADHLGRKRTLFLATVIALISIAVLVQSKDIAMLILGRFLSGISTGMLTLTTPLYLSESLPAYLRGRGTVAFQLFLTFGILFATFISWFFLKSFAWQAVFLVELVPVTVLALIAICIPESPRWLVSKGKLDQALCVLLKIRPQQAAEITLKEIVENVKTQPHISRFKGLFQKKFAFPLLLAISLGVLNQLTGINAILQYDSTILFLSGFSQHNISLIGSMLITGINFLMTIVAICIIDHIERKKLLHFGLACIIICLAGMSTAHHFMAHTALQGMIVTACLLGFIIFFALAPGAMIWTLTSELLPAKIRSAGLSIALLLSSMMGALLSTVFLPLQQKIGFSGIFLFCALTSTLYLYISYFIPETKQRSLEEIEQKILESH